MARITIYSCCSALVPFVHSGMEEKRSACAWQSWAQAKRMGVVRAARAQAQIRDRQFEEGQRRYSRKSRQLVSVRVDIEDTEQDGLVYGREAEWLSPSISLSPHLVETTCVPPLTS
ncbi:hypothetical protein BDW74DRAFT_143797 [Aspergillus multicolor]|uniref:uncharacterized protein n=1 Tax=Aspergillus multicolor TaxID=41759 RepID=UPI003CCE171B